MATRSISRSRKAGLPPGTPVHIGARRPETTRIRVMHYDAGRCDEHEFTEVRDCADLRPSGAGVTWVHVTGVHDVALLGRIGGCFGLHPLVLEDISNTDQRPKLEDYGDYAYLVFKVLHDGAETRETATGIDQSTGRTSEASRASVTTRGPRTRVPGVPPITSPIGETQVEQMSIVIGKDFVLSFEEAEPTAFDAVRARMRDNRGGIRAQGADFLAYSLLDAVVDNYFLVLERFGGRIEQLQEELIGRSTRRTEASLHYLRREMVLLRKSVWPLREVIGTLERGGSAQFRRETWLYLRDVYDHVIHMIDTLESFHEMLAYMIDLHLLSATNRLNEVIKVITVIATIFSPPMLIASIYGMNFKHMPELAWPWGYLFAGGLMLVTAGAMFWFFRRKRWV